MFADRLLDAIARTRAPVCVGLDPIFDKLPTRGAGLPVDALRAFGDGVLDAVAGLVPVVKLQSAYFEQHRVPGVQVYYDLVAHARALGLLVIGDVKRGDIGATSEAYAAAHLLGDDAPDAITVNPMLGLDSVEPFLKAAEQTGRGVFALVRTSNPGSRDFQDVALHDGRTWSEAVADALASRVTPVGAHGYASLGAVVGATQPHAMASLRARLPRSVFLLPGYGAQGATADMTRAAFDARGRGALVSASRSVLFPPPTGRGWQADVRAAAEAMVAEVRGMLGAN